MRANPDEGQEPRIRVRRPLLASSSRAMTYRAKVALHYLDQQRAVAGLRGHLATLAAEAGATPDWSSLQISAPVEVIGARGAVWYEWTATVAAQGTASPPPTADDRLIARTEVRS